MKSLLTLLAVLLLALFVTADTPLAKDRPYGYPADNESHPWGGDENADDPEGDGVEDPRRANPATLGSTGFPMLDLVFHYIFVKPTMDEVDQIGRHSVKHRFDQPAARFESQRPSMHHNRNDLQR
ncbi:hypothetical protein GF420_15995 [candidate division GN15 bacterium]|nr:hypothetical protein [candidate division GN15 bacterium]